MSEEKRNNLRKFSNVEAEDIIAKALTEAVGRESNVPIQSLSFEERKPGDYDDDCDVKLKLHHVKFSSKRVIGDRPR